MADLEREYDPVEDGILHGHAAREWAHAYLDVQNAREAIFALVREDRLYPQRDVDAERFIQAVQRYQAASARFCRTQDALHDASSLDPRPTCIHCHMRLDKGEEEQDCPALRRAYPNEPPRRQIHAIEER
jgi:hypothetical protein